MRGRSAELESLTPREAVDVQRRLARRVRTEGTARDVATVAGVDVSVRAGWATAAICTLTYPGLEVRETAIAHRAARFPYVPGLLAFRELPVVLEAFERLDARPDLLVVDGHGLAHPRRFGLACFLGLEVGVPALGCGKSRLVGEHREPGRRRGCRTQLRHDGEVIGSVLRTQGGVRPVFVSVGHRIDLESAVRVTLRCARGYRLPEPIRRADRVAGEASRAAAAIRSSG